MCTPRSVPCATRPANLPAATKPPRHRGDCAKGARKVFSQAATGRHPLQSSCNPRRAKHINPSASIDASKAMEEHVHGFAPGHCQHGLFPELATNNFPLFQTRSYQVRDSFLPTVRRLQCRVFQMTLDVIDIFLLELLRPILWGASNLHFICAHGHHHGDLHRQSLANVFQAAGRFDAAKQHRRSIRRFADHGSVQWP